MSLPADPVHLAREINHAKEKLKARRSRTEQIIQGFGGGMMLEKRDGEWVAESLIANHYYEYLSYVLPRIVSQDPRVRVRTPLDGKAALTAMASQAAVNQWIIDSRHRITAQQLCTDFLLGWGVAVLRLEDRSGDVDTDAKLWPQIDTLDTESAWWDMAARSYERKRFAGFSYAIDLDDLIEKAKADKTWNLSVIRGLATDTGLEEVRRDKGTPHRREVVVRECWVADLEVKDAPRYSNGGIVTMAQTGSGGSTPVKIREDRAFFGPPNGPLYLYDAYYVPGQSLGMSPCEAVVERVNELNRHLRQLSNDIASRKRVGIGKKTNVKDAETLQTVKHGHWALLEAGMKKDEFHEVELGGWTDNQVQAIAMLAQGLEKQSGLSDAQRGAVTGVGSPTEVAIANEAGGLRVSYLAQRFSDCDEHMLRGVLWYLMHSRGVRIKVDGAAIGKPEGVMANVEVRGGPERDMRFEDLHLSIERYTMERVSENQMRAQSTNLVQQTMMVAQAAPAISSFVDVEQLLDVVGDANNRPGWGKTIHPQRAIEMQERMQAQEEEAEMPNVDTPQARPPPLRAVGGGEAA